MINSKISKPHEESKVMLTYPVIMITKSSSLVVLFHNLHSGTVLFAEEDHWCKTGEYHEHLEAADNRVVWAKFTGCLKLSNETVGEISITGTVALSNDGK